MTMKTALILAAVVVTIAVFVAALAVVIWYVSMALHTEMPHRFVPLTPAFSVFASWCVLYLVWAILTGGNR